MHQKRERAWHCGSGHLASVDCRLAFFVPLIADTARDVTGAILVHVLSRNALIICQIHKRLNSLHKVCKFAESARITSQAKMLPNHISMIFTRPLGRIDNVALKRWALFTVE
jgi:hypothetical protein